MTRRGDQHGINPHARTRRRLITGAAAAGATYLLGGRVLGAPADETDPDATDPDATDPDALDPGTGDGDAPIEEVPELEFNTSATSNEQAVRGEQEQLRPPPPEPPANRWQPGQFITHVDVENRRISLTFDDGPSPANTPLVLDTLRRYGIKATFYLIGVNVRSFPNTARRIVEEGHEVGNHSIYHTPYSAAPLAGQMAGNQSIIRDVTGVAPVTHRAPGLTRGGIILSTARSLGVYEAHTNMQTFDWISPRYSASAIFSQFTRYLTNGALVLYHDGGGRRPTPDALPSIIEYARARGYEFTTATELVNSGNPRPGTFSYFTSSALQARTAAGHDHRGHDHGDHNHDEEYVDLCGYNAQAELESILRDGDVKLTYADRMRVVESLAEFDDLSRD
ncbi:MAG: polysaccharide deacetylase family protein [Actinomycetota bacterium]